MPKGPFPRPRLRKRSARYSNSTTPVPFHEVRTRFLGNVATPVMSASPIKMVAGLWSGQLPEFSSIDEANELIGALIISPNPPRCGCHA
jgi:hypothetical protein